MPTNPRECIVVLGMHRSGTSALTGVLTHLGADAGPRLMAPQDDVNPKGFWEHTDIVDVHETVLKQLGSSWNDARAFPAGWVDEPWARKAQQSLRKIIERDFSKSAIWVIKDPRMCRLLPLWHPVIEGFNCRLTIVICLRSPGEVALSLQTRDDLSTPESSLLWLSYMLDAEYHTRSLRRSFVVYKALLHDWRAETDRISRELDLRWPVRYAVAAPAITQFIDPALRHHVDTLSMSGHPACALAERVFNVFEAFPPNQSRIDELRQRDVQLLDLISPWAKSAHARRELAFRLSVMKVERDGALAEVTRIKGSIAWRITSPIRIVANFLARCGFWTGMRR